MPEILLTTLEVKGRLPLFRYSGKREHSPSPWMRAKTSAHRRAPVRNSRCNDLTRIAPKAGFGSLRDFVVATAPMTAGEKHYWIGMSDGPTSQRNGRTHRMSWIFNIRDVPARTNFHPESTPLRADRTMQELGVCAPRNRSQLVPLGLQHANHGAAHRRTRSSGFCQSFAATDRRQPRSQAKAVEIGEVRVPVPRRRTTNG